MALLPLQDIDSKVEDSTRNRKVSKVIQGENMRKALSIALVMIFASMAIFAQGGTSGRLVGTVSAPDGAVPGAVVTITDSQTGRVRTVTAGDDGTFEVSQLSFGVYSIKITANGFKTFSAPDVKIDANREFALNAMLEVGQISEEVTVVAGAENVNSNRSRSFDHGQRSADPRIAAQHT
jgi:hypothetical protein